MPGHIEQTCKFQGKYNNQSIVLQQFKKSLYNSHLLGVEQKQILTIQQAIE